MSELMTITHYREVTEIARYEAEVDPQHYIEWCKEADYEASELWVLQEYLLEGHGNSEYKESVDVCGSDFRDFEDAGYASQLVKAAQADDHRLPESELRQIVVDEIARHGRFGRPISIMCQMHGLNEADSDAATVLMMGATVTIDL